MVVISKGYLEISSSASRHQHLGISIGTVIGIGIGITNIVKILFLLYKCFYEKKADLRQIHLNILSYAELFGISFLLLQLLICRGFPTLYETTQ